MALVAWALPAWRLAVPGRIVIAVAVAFVGGFFGIGGIVAFHRAKTTIHPMNPSEASSLVVNGVYTHTRNPMYLGLLIVLFSWSVYLAHPATLVLLPGFVAYMNRFQIIPEERAMASNFGADFEAYRARVRRWL